MKSSILLWVTLSLFGIGGLKPALYAASADVTLAKDGRSVFVILHAPAAPSSVQTAAKELQHYLEATTRATLPIVASDVSPKVPFIALGDTAAARAAGIVAREIPIEGFRLASREGNLFVVGLDTKDGEKTPQGGTSTGTLNGVYSFIEEFLGVRWLLPGEAGEDVPQRDIVLIPSVDRMDQPAFLNRRLPGVQNGQKAVEQWSQRQKLGYSLLLEHSHNWQQVVPAALHDAHPDWFAEFGGKRPPPVGDRYKLETTNAELVQHFAQTAIDAFRRDPHRTVFSLSPSDSDNWSTSAASKALYDKDPHGKLSVTPLILKFYNDVAKIVGKEFPDRKLAGYIYASYLYPPSGGVPPMEPNLFIVVAPSISYGYQLYRESVQQDWVKVMKAWSAHTSQIAYYDLFNWLKGSTGAITPPAPEILNFALPKLKDYGIKGIYIYGTEEWSQAAVNNYVLAKMAWNPNLDANALCDEYYRRAYGPAAGSVIRELTHRIDAAVKTFYNADLTANYTATPRYMSEVLAANYPQIETAYQEASAASAAATPAQRARLEFFGDNLIVMQWQLRSQGFLPETKDSPLYRSDADIEPMLGRLHPGFGVLLAPRMKRADKTFPPVRVAWSPPLANPQPVTPLALRGPTRFLFFPRGDVEIQITAKRISGLGGVARCDAYTAAGAKVAGGNLRADNTLSFLGSAGQIYYVEVSGGPSYYELELKGSPYALAANTGNRGVRVQGKATPLYFRVSADVPKFTITTSSGAPGETSLGQLYAPSGKLVETLDTQSTPTARVTITKETSGEWEGFWCLSIGKAPKGAFDDVEVSLDAALPQWFTLDPHEPLVILPIDAIRK